jgi:branched-chain amino acid transport system permease protein
MLSVLQAVINGLMMGGVYVLVALGLSMIHGVMKIVNFAQADFVMIGMFVSLILMPLVNNTVPYYLFPLVVIIVFLISLVIFKLAISKVIGKGSHNYILLTMGLSYFLQYSVQLIFGPTPFPFPVIDELKYGAISFYGLIAQTPRFIAFVVTIVLVILFTLFLNNTYTGRAMRATSESSLIAATLGVPTTKIYIIAFGLATVLAGVAGLLISPVMLLSPQVGVNFSTMATAAMVMGGLGSLPGAMIGGLFIGLVDSFVQTFMMVELAPIIVNVLLIVVLMVKPYGLFGKGAQKV